jgi:ATP-binding cassette subfamily F protein 3
MELLAGNISPDGGKRELSKNASVLLVKQELPDDDESPLEYLRNNDPEVVAAEAALSKSSAANIGDAADLLAELEQTRYDVLAPKVLSGLGLTQEQMNKPMRNLSDGMRMRINLASSLIRQPKVLLLDEPSNYLDLEATQWLIHYLKTYPEKCAVVMVSHDLSILKQVTTATVHLRTGTLTLFSGDYETYKEQLAVREKNDQRKNEALEKQIERHEIIYNRFKDLPESRAAQAVAQLKKADKKREQLVEIVQEEAVIDLNFNNPSVLGDPILSMDKISIGYTNNMVLSNVELSLQANSKVGILGQNGQGKSTLIRAIVEKITPTKGTLIKNPVLKIGYFSQDATEELSASSSVYEEFKKKTGITNDSEIRSTLSRYGFGRDKISTMVEHLSGGEKSRLMFCLICTQSPHLIILDEPTNHLDVETREKLTIAINNYKGCVVLVSHDADLHMQTMDKFWLVKDGSVQVYDKGLSHYQNQLQRAIELNASPYSTPKNSAPNTPTSSPSKAKKSPQSPGKNSKEKTQVGGSKASDIGFYSNNNNGSSSSSNSPTKNNNYKEKGSSANRVLSFE